MLEEILMSEFKEDYWFVCNLGDYHDIDSLKKASNAIAYLESWVPIVQTVTFTSYDFTERKFKILP